MSEKFDNIDFIDFNSTNPNTAANNLFVDLFEIVWRNKWWFILSLIVFLCGGVYYVWSTPKTYSSKATILLIQDRNGNSSISETMDFEKFYFSQNNFVNNQIGLIKSPRLMLGVVNNLQLDMVYSTESGFKRVDIYEKTPVRIEFMDADVNQNISISITPINETEVMLSNIIAGGIKTTDNYIVPLGKPIETAFLGEIVVTPTAYLDESYLNKQIFVNKLNPEAAALMYADRLSVVLADKMSELLNISITGTNPRKVADILNSLISTYQQDLIDSKNVVLENTTKFIDERLALIERDLQMVDAEIENYKKTNKLTNISSESSMYLQNYSRLDNEELSMENQLSLAEYMRSYLNDNANITELIPANIGISDPAIEDRIGEYNTLLTKRNKLLANSSENNPLVVELQNTLLPLRLSIQKSIDNLIAGLKIKVDNFARRERENSSRISSVPTQQKYITSVERQQMTKEELFLFLLNKRESSELRRSATESNCKVIDKARYSFYPLAPNKTKVVLICIVLALTLPAVWLYIKTISNTKIRTRKDLDNHLNIPFLSELPLTKEKTKDDIVVREGNKNAINEAFNILRDNIEFMKNSEGHTSRVIQLASFNPGSGKTFITINLGASLALGGAKVLALDLDLRKASLTKRSGHGIKKQGMSQLLSAKVEDYKSLIIPYNKDINGFDFIPSGAIPPNPVNLLRNDRLKEIIDALQKDYDYILIDNPPYSIVADASICARHCDQSICILRSDKFDKRQLPEVQALYESGKINDMSILINALDYRKISTSYGYGYGYGYGNGYGYGQTYGHGYIEQDKKRSIFGRSKKN